jgi:hypothetical protein
MLAVTSCVVLVPVVALGAETDCTYAGKLYSQGAILCVAKNIAMVCNQPLILGPAPSTIPVATLTTTTPASNNPTGWRIVLEDNGLIGGQNSCAGNTGATPQ